MLRVVVALVVLAGCPNKSPERRFEEAYATFSEHTEKMCACKDKACADFVQEKMIAWSSEMAKRAESAKDHKPTDEQLKKFTEVAQRYSECMTKAMTTPELTGDPLPEPPAPSVPDVTGTDADQLLRGARAWVEARRPGLVLRAAEIEYAGGDGQLDAQHGKLTVTFGQIDPGLDPKRRLGAPVPAPPATASCLMLTYERSRWTALDITCLRTPAHVPRCSVAQVWKRAIDKQAPAEALAKLAYESTAKGATWTFTIDDEPREVHVRHDVPDDCPLEVEK